jgi:hypothetical protein
LVFGTEIAEEPSARLRKFTGSAGATKSIANKQPWAAGVANPGTVPGERKWMMTRQKKTVARGSLAQSAG